MINISPLLKDIPACIHSVLDPLPPSALCAKNIITKTDQSKTTVVDLEIQKKLQDILLSHFPSFNSWGEESFLQEDSMKSTNITKGAHWVIDPIDGTTNFINNIPSYCTTLSLIIDGEVIAGITYDPNRKELFHAIKSQGTFLNQQKISPSTLNPALKESVVAVDFKRLSRSQREFIAGAQPYYSQRNFGSSGIEWAWLSLNRVNVYLHGSLCLWDYACGLLSLQELGGVVTDLEGRSINNALSLDKSSILASQSPSLHAAWLELLQKNKNAGS